MEPRKPSKPYSGPYDEKKLRRHLPPTPEWGSPGWLVKSASEAMGGITTDPCTSPIFQEVIQAPYAYTAQDNGLAQPWYGNVFINPPVMHARAFWARMVDDWQAGVIDQGIFVSSYPDHGSQLRKRYEPDPYVQISDPAHGRKLRKVLHDIRPFSDAVMLCLFEGRVKFMQFRPDWEKPGIEHSKGARHGGNWAAFLPPKNNTGEAMDRFYFKFIADGDVGHFNHYRPGCWRK